MSRPAVRRVLLAGLLTLALQPAAHAQETPSAEARVALEARIDSLLEEKARVDRLMHERDSAGATAAQALVTDTTIVGPFLFVDRVTPPDEAVTALRNAWEARAPVVGDAVARLDGVVISMSLSARDLGTADPVYHYRPRVRHARPEYEDAAQHVVAAALVGAMPADVQEWIGNGSLHAPDAFVWAYRDLATSGSIPARDCYRRDMDACVLALTGDAAPLMNAVTRISLLQHALELGGGGAYARFIADAPDVGTRLARAANRPLEDVMTTWRDALQDARPRVHAGVARAGLWTLLWLAGLALLSMRSTRWRLG